MKKLIVTVALAFSCAAFGAWEKIGTVQVADFAALAGGVSKLGEFTGNQMLGLMASQSLSKLPCFELFGSGREKVPFALSLFWDGQDFEYAVLYPVAQKQADFVKAHGGKVGADGVITIAPEEDEKGEKSDLCHVLFSPDGKWAAASDKKAQLAPALKDIQLAERPMNGDLVRLVMNKAGMRVFRQELNKASAKSKSQVGSRRTMEMLADCESFVCGLGVDDRGLSLRGTLNALKDSKLSKCGLTPLPSSPFAFAGKDALFATAVAKDCGYANIDLGDLRKILAKHGIKTDFLLEEEKDGARLVTLDIPAAVAYFKGATNALEKVDGDKLKADLEKMFAGFETFEVENPEMRGSFAVKGSVTTAAPVDRLKKVLPETADKKPYSIQVWSLYALVKAVLPHVQDAMDPTERMKFAPVLAMLPPAGDGGIACATWREKDAHRFLLRVSADEFKCVSAGFTLFAARQMMEKPKKPRAKPAKKAAQQEHAEK